jgi:hypothetical protein
MQDSIVDATYALTECVTECEKLTLYLMNKLGQDSAENAYLKYFGGTIFDRKETIEFYRSLQPREPKVPDNEGRLSGND